MGKTFGQVLKKLRKSKGFTGEKLSEITGISRVSLGNYERGSREPKPSTLSKIARGLGVSKLYLFKEAGFLDENDILDLVDENKRLREALEFYADESNYNKITLIGRRFNVLLDNGEIARKALEVD